jgi:hypothetical protein
MTTHSVETRAAVRRLWAEGLPASEIGRRLKPRLTKHAVTALARRLGLSDRGAPRRDGASVAKGRGRRKVPSLAELLGEPPGERGDG